MAGGCTGILGERQAVRVGREAWYSGHAGRLVRRGTGLCRHLGSRQYPAQHAGASPELRLLSRLRWHNQEQAVMMLRVVDRSSREVLLAIEIKARICCCRVITLLLHHYAVSV